jgi:hypothetical protein
VRRDLTTRSVSLEKERKMKDRSVIGQFIFIRSRLFKKRITELDLNWSGKTPEARERLMIVVMVGSRAEVHFFRRVEGI